MKLIYGLLILLTLMIFNPVAALSHSHCPPRCYYYYGYNFASSAYDYEVDTACVDFCIDKKHSLQQCMHSCSNTTRPIDYDVAPSPGIR